MFSSTSEANLLGAMGDIILIGFISDIINGSALQQSQSLGQAFTRYKMQIAHHSSFKFPGLNGGLYEIKADYGQQSACGRQKYGSLTGGGEYCYIVSKQIKN